MGSDLRVMRGFQNGSTLGGSISRSDDIEVLHKGVAKKICKIFASELGSKSGVMRGFKKGITLGGGTSRSDHKKGLQKGVAKKFAKYLHLSWDPSRGS